MTIRDRPYPSKISSAPSAQPQLITGDAPNAAAHPFEAIAAVADCIVPPCPLYHLNLDFSTSPS